MPMGPSPIKSENFNRSNPPPVISSNGTVAIPNSMGDRRGPPGKTELLILLSETSFSAQTIKFGKKN
jgi:hypothetical protein